MQWPFEVRLAPGLERADGALEQIQVETEADLGDLAALLIAQEFSGAADLEIVGGEREARAQVLERLDGLQALARIGRERRQRRCEQVRVGPVVRAADPAAQLVQ